MSTRGHAERISIEGGRPLRGTLRTPGDKSISHRALLIGALAEGTSLVRGISEGDDVARTAAALEAMGAVLRRADGALSIEGGRPALGQPPPLDCGNSGTSMRLLAGVVAGFPWTTTLFGDASLSARPMDRIALPLGAMGASVEGTGPTLTPPIVVRGTALRAIDWSPPMASAQVKSAILFAGLDAQGATVVREPLATRAHTEELLALAGADIEVESWGRGRVVTVRRSSLTAIDLDVPGDPSQGAFWIVGACVIPGSDVVVEHLYAGRERIGFLGVLERMGALVSRSGTAEGTADVAASHRELHGTEVDAAEIPSLDEVPALAVAAAAASGTTTFRDVSELRVKESDRLMATIALVEACGGAARAEGDRLIVEGTGRIGPGPVRLESRGDHRLAMAGVIAALASPGGGTIGGIGAIDTSYPRFLADLEALAGPGAWSASGERP